MQNVELKRKLLSMHLGECSHILTGMQFGMTHLFLMAYPIEFVDPHGGIGQLEEVCVNIIFKLHILGSPKIFLFSRTKQFNSSFQRF